MALTKDNEEFLASIGAITDDDLAAAPEAWLTKNKGTLTLARNKAMREGVHVLVAPLTKIVVRINTELRSRTGGF